MKLTDLALRGLGKRPLVGFDVEWTKNYQIKNGNRPFCFSVVWLPRTTQVAHRDAEVRFGLAARYIDHLGEEQALIDAADQLLGRFMECGATFIGHQFSSDLSVLLAATTRSLPNVEALRAAWGQRRLGGHGFRVVDTRYDLTAFLPEKSRRLVDVCATYRLDVTQPELRGSMTLMQRKFLAGRDEAIRERLSVLNIRHSLSSVLLYCCARDGVLPQGGYNVNRALRSELASTYSYVRNPEFDALVREADEARREPALI